MAVKMWMKWNSRTHTTMTSHDTKYLCVWCIHKAQGAFTTQILCTQISTELPLSLLYTQCTCECNERSSVVSLMREWLWTVVNLMRIHRIEYFCADIWMIFGWYWDDPLTKNIKTNSKSDKKIWVGKWNNYTITS